MKKISLRGSTGSIGTNVLDVIERNPGKFQIVGMSAGNNVDLFAKQIRKFKPRVVALFDTKKIHTNQKKNIIFFTFFQFFSKSYLNLL